MANESAEASINQTPGRVVAGASGFGAGGVFSFFLFSNLGIADLLQDNTLYAISVFSAVVCVILLTGYVASERARDVTFRIGIVFFALTFLGTLSPTIYQAFVRTPVTVNVRLGQDLTQWRTPTRQLDVKFDNGPPVYSLTTSEYTQIEIARDEILIDLSSIIEALRELEANLALSKQCYGRPECELPGRTIADVEDDNESG